LILEEQLGPIQNESNSINRVIHRIMHISELVLIYKSIQILRYSKKS